jgi:hypothetical protein
MVDSSQLIHGMDIFTSDGDRIGRVGELHGSYFKVDTPMMPDYWLSTDCLLSGGSSGVRLNFSKDELGDYKLDKPEDVTYR